MHNRKKYVTNELSRASGLIDSADRHAKSGNLVQVLALEQAVQQLFTLVAPEPGAYADLLPQMESLMASMEGFKKNMDRRRNLKLVVSQ